jgi:hypothetical protein
MTNYLAITGTGAAFPADRTIHLADVRDGDDKTIAIIESRDTGISWLEPSDMPLDRLAPLGAPSSPPGVRPGHDHGGYAAFVDGSVRFLRFDDLSLSTIRALGTISGGEFIDMSRP